MPRLANKRRIKRRWSFRALLLHRLCIGCGPLLRGTGRKEHQMLDLTLLALGLGFFVLTIGYAYACDRL